MKSYSFVVNEKPPYKQCPATPDETNNQERYKQALLGACSSPNDLIKGRFSLSVRYSRKSGRADGGNIINGILDCLQQAKLYEDDKGAVEIHYYEWRGEAEWYQVTVAEIKE